MVEALIASNMTCLVLVALLIYQAKNHAAQIKELLNRLMARNYGEFIALEKTQGSTKPRRISMTDEREAQIERERQASKEKTHA